MPAQLCRETGQHKPSGNSPAKATLLTGQTWVNTGSLPAQNLPESRGWLLFFGEETDIQKSTCVNIPGLGNFDFSKHEPGPAFHPHP